MKSACPRSWEVEAARDGRLVGDARHSYDAHLSTCRTCADDSAALDELARGLRSLADAELNDVSVRRLRNRVLESVDAGRAGRRRASHRGGAVVMAALGVLILALGAFAFASRRPPQRADAPASVAPRAETTVDVTASSGAELTRASKEDVERFELHDGTLRLRVRRTPEGRRVMVMLPDGEIEDIGTVFEVTVTNGRTERVSVEEGRVVLRLQGEAPVTIDAGGGWRRPHAVAASASAKREAAPRPVPVVPVAKASAVDAKPSAEDKAYLEVLRLLEGGREAEARAAATAYLREFPAGFRREEMQRVASGL